MSEPTRNVVESTTLLPCPFCGGNYVQFIEYKAGYGTVGCGACQFEKPDSSVVILPREEAIAAWNRRANGATTRHGKYRTKYGRRVPLCERCGYSIGDLRWKFCPGCGAEVDE